VNQQYILSVAPKHAIDIITPMVNDPGRPPKKPEDRRSNRLVIKLTEGERELLADAANPDAVTVWARGVLLRAAKRRKNER
jgi:hypothetical protein